MPFARSVFFIFTLLIMVKASAHEDLIEQLKNISERTKLNPTSCTPDDSAAKKKIQDKKFCAAIKETVASENSHVCTPYYKDGKPHWEDPALKLELQTYATKDAIPKSRSDFEKEGYTIATLAQEKELITKLTQIRADLTPSCCGSDTACQEALQSVTLRLCRNSAADNNSNSPDACTLTDGYFQASPSAADQYQILKTIYGGARTEADRAYIRDVTKRSEAEVDQTLKATGAVRSTVPVPGEVVVSPYFADGFAKVRDRTLRHEVAHACSSIKRQLSALRGNSDAAISLAIQQRRDDVCSLHPKAINAYAHLLEDVRESRVVSKCLYQLALNSNDPTSYAYVPKSCAGSKLEEGFAIARSLLEAPFPIVPKTFPARECSSLPSTKHPASGAVADCIVRHSTAFRSKLERELKCAR